MRDAPPPRYDKTHPWGPAVNLRRVRRDRGWTAATLAQRAGLSMPYLCDVERGDKIPSLIVAQRIADALELDLPLPYPPVPAGYLLLPIDTTAYLVAGLEHLANQLIDEEPDQQRNAVVLALDEGDPVIDAYDRAVAALGVFHDESADPVAELEEDV